MTKRRAYGSVHGAIMQDVGAIGLQLGSDGHEAVAAFLGLNSFAPRRWGDPDDTRELSLLRAGQIAREFGVTAMAEWLAACAGCRLVPIDADDCDLASVMAALGQMVTGLADGDVSEQDLEQAERLQKLISALLINAHRRREAGTAPLRAVTT